MRVGRHVRCWGGRCGMGWDALSRSRASRGLCARSGRSGGEGRRGVVRMTIWVQCGGRGGAGAGVAGWWVRAQLKLGGVCWSQTVGWDKGGARLDRGVWAVAAEWAKE